MNEICDVALAIVGEGLVLLARVEYHYESIALFWQPGSMKRIAKAFRERFRAVYARKLATVAKSWVQFEHPRSTCPRFFQPTEFGMVCERLRDGVACFTSNNQNWAQTCRSETASGPTVSWGLRQ